MVEQVLLAIGLLGVLCVVTACTATFVVVRRVRRRWRRWRARAGAGWTGGAAAASVASPRWWAVQQRRHRLWTAVSSAQQAVRVAVRAGVPVGDLPTLVTRLGSAAGAVDAVLRASGRGGSLSPADRRDYERIVATADEVRSAALSSLRSGARTETDTVVSALQLEVAALAAGVRAARR